MILVSGYGLFVIIGVYVISFFAVSKIMPSNTTNFTQTILIVVTCVFTSVINYIIAKLLNKKEVKHTVCGARLEIVVLCLGAFLLFLALMMLGGALKDLNA